MIRLANVQLWVHDQDEALAFYSGKLGWQVRQDLKMPELGDFRWLAVGPADQPDINVVLWSKFAFICATAGMTASVRLPTPSLVRMLLTWNFAVDRLTTRRFAISALLSP